MLVTAAVCPHPPLIVPELAGAAAAELDDLRTSCASAIRSLAEARPGLLVVVGGARTSSTYPGDASGTFKPWGLNLRVGGRATDIMGGGESGGEPSLPLSLTVGRWLLERAWPGSLPELRFEAVAMDASPGECAALGRRVAGSAARVAVLTMADGSARLTEKSPGYVHPEAVPYNEMLLRALGEAATDRLGRLDPAEAAEMWVAGRAAFQVLAAAADPPPDVAELLYDDAPYGVGYAVARWLWRR